MATKTGTTPFHVNPDTGRSGKCNARSREKCPLKEEDGKPVPHFDTKEEANKYITDQAAEKHDAFKTVSKKKTSTPTKVSEEEPPTTQRMSFEKFDEELEKRGVLTEMGTYFYPPYQKAKRENFPEELEKEFVQRAIDRANKNGKTPPRENLNEHDKNSVIEREINFMRQEAHEIFVKEEYARQKQREETFISPEEAVAKTFDPKSIDKNNIEKIYQYLRREDGYSYDSYEREGDEEEWAEITHLDEDTISWKVYNSICVLNNKFEPDKIYNQKPTHTTPEPEQREAMKVVKEVLRKNGALDPKNYYPEIIHSDYYEDKIEDVEAYWGGSSDTKEKIAKELLEIFEKAQSDKNN